MGLASSTHEEAWGLEGGTPEEVNWAGKEVVVAKKKIFLFLATSKII